MCVGYTMPVQPVDAKRQGHHHNRNAPDRTVHFQAEDMVAATLGGAAMQTNHLFSTQPLGQTSAPGNAESMRSELASLKSDLYAGLDARIAAALEEHDKAGCFKSCTCAYMQHVHNREFKVSAP